MGGTSLLLPGETSVIPKQDGERNGRMAAQAGPVRQALLMGLRSTSPFSFNDTGVQVPPRALNPTPPLFISFSPNPLPTVHSALPPAAPCASQACVQLAAHLICKYTTENTVLFTLRSLSTCQQWSRVQTGNGLNMAFFLKF